MQAFQKIAIGVDLAVVNQESDSPYTEATSHAIEQGLWTAERLGAAVLFVTSLDLPPRAEALFADATFEETEERLVEETKAALNELVTTASERGITAGSHVCIGTPWRELTRVVQTESCDLLVIGGRAESTLDRLLFGSTARKVVRACPCAVLVTNRPAIGEDEVLDVTLTTALDESGEQMLHRMVANALMLEARLRVLHVIEDPVRMRILHTGITPDKLKELADHDLEGAKETLHRQLATTDSRTLTHGVVIDFATGRPEERIRESVRESNPDWLVMGTAGRSGLSGWLLGNTVEEFMTGVGCSLLIFKSPGFHCPVSAE